MEKDGNCHKSELRCVSSNCPAQLKEKLRYFAGRDQMNIENLGPALIDRLVDEKISQRLCEIYTA